MISWIQIIAVVKLPIDIRPNVSPDTNDQRSNIAFDEQQMGAASQGTNQPRVQLIIPRFLERHTR